MQTIFERVSFGELASHPTRTSAMSDDRRHPTHVCDRVCFGKLTKALQLPDELQHHVLVNVVGFGALRVLMRVEAKFETNDAFDHWLSVARDQL